MLSQTKKDRIEVLLKRAYQSHDWDEMRRLALEVLELDANQLEALVLLSDASEDEREQIGLLRRALALLPSSQADVSRLTRDKRELKATILERLATALLEIDPNEALVHASQAIETDPVYCETSRSLLYSALLLLRRFGDVLIELFQDITGCPARFYARALALYCLGGKGEAFFQGLWEALAKDPDMAFYALGFWPDPPQEDDDEWDYLRVASIMIVPWLDHEEAYGWLMTATLLFGYLTDRLPDATLEELKPYLIQVDFMDEMNRSLGEFEAMLRPLGELSPEEIDAAACRYLRQNELSRPLWRN